MHYKKKEYNSKTLRDYATDFIKYDTICTQAPMGFGKTKNLITLLETNEYKNKKIIIVSFRRSLMKQYKKVLPSFSYYTQIKDRKIDLDTHRKLIIQADSLYRIRGEIDMLVMDECTYTLDHLVTYVKKFKSQCVNALEHLLHTSGKILAIDALFTDDYVNLFTQYRKKILYAVNTYKFHQNKNVVMYGNDFQSFFNKMMESLRRKEKIVVCTNSKIKLNYFEDKIRKEFDNISCLFMDGDHEVAYSIDDWIKMDVIGYTPTITAGVSFELKHFDRVFGYFVSGSSNAALSIQQLFRVRNINKNQYNICVDVTASSNYPVEYEDLDKIIEDRHESLIDGHEVLNLDYGKKIVNKDSYYHLYRTVMRYNNLSKNNYQNELIRLLNTQGITDITKTGKHDKMLNRALRKDYKTFKEQKEEQVAISVSESNDIDSEVYHDLCNKENLKRNERNSVLKYSFLEQTKIDRTKLTAKVYQEYKPKLMQFHNLSFIKHNKTNLKAKINKRIAYNDLCKHDGKSIDILHRSKKYEKLAILNDTVSILGWEDLNDAKKIDLNYNHAKLIPVLKKMESLFSTSIHTWDIKQKNTRTSILRYINSRLKNTLDMTMSYDKATKKYSLCTLSSWSFMYENFGSIQNILNENERNFDTKLELEMWTYKFMNDLLPDDDIAEENTKLPVNNEETLVYETSNPMDYINMFREKNKDRMTKKNMVKPNRRVKVYRDSHQNKHKGPAFMMEEIEKWDKDGSIHKNMGGEYEGLDIHWTDPEWQATTTNKQAYERVLELFQIEEIGEASTGPYTLNGYTRDDISNIGREQILWGQYKQTCDSNSDEEPEYDFY